MLRSAVDHTTDSYALFGNLTYDFTDDFTVTGGLRYTQEKKDIDLDLTQLTRCCLKLAFGFPACDRDSPALPAATRRAKEWQRTTRTFRSRRSPHSAQPHSRPAAARLSVV